MMISNAAIGAKFEIVALEVLEKELGFKLDLKFPLEIGNSSTKKYHNYDLGSTEHKVVVECKCHKWTSGGNSPSAKLYTWISEMYLLSLAPSDYRKLFFVNKNTHIKKGSLAQYFINRYGHLIPDDVEIWEYDEELKVGKIL